MSFAYAERARQAYSVASAPTRTARDAERQILTQVTARLRTAAAHPQDFAGLARAIHDNRLIWTRFAADVAEAGNGLPQSLRARLFFLAEFTHQHSRKVLRGRDGPGPLIEINTAVIRGLAGQPPTEGTA